MAMLPRVNSRSRSCFHNKSKLEIKKIHSDLCSIKFPNENEEKESQFGKEDKIEI